MNEENPLFNEALKHITYRYMELRQGYSPLRREEPCYCHFMDYNCLYTPSHRHFVQPRLEREIAQ